MTTVHTYSGLIGDTYSDNYKSEYRYLHMWGINGPSDDETTMTFSIVVPDNMLHDVPIKKMIIVNDKGRVIKIKHIDEYTISKTFRREELKNINKFKIKYWFDVDWFWVNEVLSSEYQLEESWVK